MNMGSDAMVKYLNILRKLKSLPFFLERFFFLRNHKIYIEIFYFWFLDEI